MGSPGSLKPSPPLRFSTSLEESYRHCAAITRREAKNFYYGFRFLTPLRRRSIYAIYAFSRLLDDIVDDVIEDASKGARDAEKAREKLEYMRKLLGDEAAPDDPLAPALQDSVRQFEIPHEPFHDLITGMIMDLEGHDYKTFEDLKLYCYRAASTVGLICIEIFGYETPAEPETIRDPAISLGLAMQLTNILRDVAEDFSRGRVYLPKEELDRFGVTRDTLERKEVSENFRELMKFQVERARDYFRRSDDLFPQLDPASRYCPVLLRSFYSEILNRIEAANYDVFTERPRLPRWKKLQLAARIWLRSRVDRN